VKWIGRSSCIIETYSINLEWNQILAEFQFNVFPSKTNCSNNDSVRVAMSIPQLYEAFMVRLQASIPSYSFPVTVLCGTV
jgi:hypothetical protein